jgi:hypothetical protein
MLPSGSIHAPSMLPPRSLQAPFMLPSCLTCSVAVKYGRPLCPSLSFREASRATEGRTRQAWSVLVSIAAHFVRQHRPCREVGPASPRPASVTMYTKHTASISSSLPLLLRAALYILFYTIYMYIPYIYCIDILYIYNFFLLRDPRTAGPSGSG